MIEAGKKILKQTSAQYVVITRGKDGMAIFSAKSPIVKLIPTYVKEVLRCFGSRGYRDRGNDPGSLLGREY